MTSQHELDRILGDFFVNGTDELADRVIDAALDEIDHTHQRHPLRMPRRLQTMPMFTRVAVAAGIGVLAIGGAFYLMQPGKSAVGGPGTTPVASASPTETPTPTPSPNPSLSLEKYRGPMTTGRQFHSATQLADGRILVAGGYDGSDGTINSADVYDPVSDTFRPTGPLTTARGLHTATQLSDGRVLITGGGPVSWVTSVGPFFTSAEIYDPATGTFNNAGSLTTPREDHTATMLSDGRVLITGGNDAADHGVASAELYDPATGAFSPTGPMTTARGFHTATRLTDGRVLITGGDPAVWTNPGPYLASAELYDPRTGTFTATGAMADGREFHTATLLADGRVLITGGVTEGGATESLASAELYDPRTRMFSPTASMGAGRAYHTATLLSDGRVLIAGGLPHGRVYSNNPEFLASAEIYDPANGTFTATGSMADRRSTHQATLLADGRVLVTGGQGDLAPLAAAELYDPLTGTFSPAGAGG